MAVVKEYHDGELTVRIHDDFFVKTDEEIDEILRDLATIVQQDYARRMMIKEEENRKVMEDKKREKRAM